MKKTPTSSVPAAPSHLSAKAKAWWRKICSEWILDDPGLLTLQSGLEAFDRMVEAQEILRQDGPVVSDRFGQRKQHPATLIERDSRSAMLSALKQLHLDIIPLNDRPGRPAGR